MADKLAILDAVAATGVRRVEVTSFVSLSSNSTAQAGPTSLAAAAEPEQQQHRILARSHALRRWPATGPTHHRTGCLLRRARNIGGPGGLSRSGHCRAGNG